MGFASGMSQCIYMSSKFGVVKDGRRGGNGGRKIPLAREFIGHSWGFSRDVIINIIYPYQGVSWDHNFLCGTFISIVLVGQ